MMIDQHGVTSQETWITSISVWEPQISATKCYCTPYTEQNSHCFKAPSPHSEERCFILQCYQLL